MGPESLDLNLSFLVTVSAHDFLTKMKDHETKDHVLACFRSAGSKIMFWQEVDGKGEGEGDNGGGGGRCGSKKEMDSFLFVFLIF